MGNTPDITPDNTRNKPASHPLDPSVQSTLSPDCYALYRSAQDQDCRNCPNRIRCHQDTKLLAGGDPWVIVSNYLDRNGRGATATTDRGDYLKICQPDCN